MNQRLKNFPEWSVFSISATMPSAPLTKSQRAKPRTKFCPYKPGLGPRLVIHTVLYILISYVNTKHGPANSAFSNTKKELK
jgi:hypothetical protein